MKKLVAVAILSLAAVSSWAQSQVDFRNSGPTFGTVADRLVYNGAVGGQKLVGTNYAAALVFVVGAGNAGQLAGPSSGVQAGALAFFRVTTTASPGAWNPSSVFARTVDGVPLGGTATMQVRVWDTLKYSTFATAFAAGEYGMSAPFDWTAPAGTKDVPAPLENFRAFAVVPEPSTLALGVLGAASLLFLRRRK
jgi:hypothetical protein